MGTEKEDINETIIATKIMQQKASGELGITKEYNKENRDKLWDSTKGKKEYKEKVFEGKKTYVDPISGKVLHKNQKAAQNKYHMKNENGENISTAWASHSAETDHINALKDLHDTYRYDPFLSDADFKEVANSDSNYRILSKKENTSKGDKNDWQIILEKDSDLPLESRVELAKQKMNADVVVHSKFATRTVENMGKEFKAGAKETLINSAIPLTSEAVRKMCKVASGEETLEEAAKDFGKTVVDVAVVGGTQRLIVDTINNQLSNSNNLLFSKFANSSTVSKLVGVAVIVNESAVKYINGEIDAEQFVSEVGEKGVNMVASMIVGSVGKEIGQIIGGAVGTAMLPGLGTAAGAVIGEVLGTIITTVACSTLVSFYHTAMHFEDYKIQHKEFDLLVESANKEIQNQREIFKGIVEREYKYWDEEFDKGFQIISDNLNDADGIAQGLDTILNVFGKKVAFKTTEEYKAQLNKALVLSF